VAFHASALGGEERSRSRLKGSWLSCRLGEGLAVIRIGRGLGCHPDWARAWLSSGLGEGLAVIRIGRGLGCHPNLAMSTHIRVMSALPNLSCAIPCVQGPSALLFLSSLHSPLKYLSMDPTSSQTQSIEGRIYILDFVQQPIRGRECGYGNRV
jgi:hypothetical protein